VETESVPSENATEDTFESVVPLSHEESNIPKIDDLSETLVEGTENLGNGNVNIENLDEEVKRIKRKIIEIMSVKEKAKLQSLKSCDRSKVSVMVNKVNSAVETSPTKNN